MATCWGLDPWALSGMCLGNDVSRGLRSLGPWLDLLGRRQLSAGPVGSSLQIPGASALWLLVGFPGTLPCSALGHCSSPGDGSSGVPVLWGALWMSKARISCPRSRGPVLWLLTLAIAYFYGETLYTQAYSHSDP
ncbi:hypothetical protein ILYODFUR_006305 [Ilyodon furcidens]|uniref:Uncharacterized protein n=1 Tax=Ilyodon furcidens TaxID=33524 RepID=A0ABV0U651_9TELE